MIKFQAWADSHANFPYHVRAPFLQIHDGRHFDDVTTWL